MMPRGRCLCVRMNAWVRQRQRGRARAGSKEHQAGGFRRHRNRGGLGRNVAGGELLAVDVREGVKETGRGEAVDKGSGRVVDRERSGPIADIADDVDEDEVIGDLGGVRGYWSSRKAKNENQGRDSYVLQGSLLRESRR